MAKQITQLTPSLPLIVLAQIAETVAQRGYADDLPALEPDDLVVLNLLVQAAELRLH